ncbi:uncharacterized protein EV420DRAFT_1643906 [Desarmillaria tabescens]|uniref:Uncharacterized protein n=1 Tax=Armillaria tabescens TaxID=1929756 RepID=A0AA39KD18_ARMTA|nr:uncharacterized protein EV420DRAFT_1643906 [Desarmillaria tabescens]KAK0457569.1 hypothetical protein EV420DRAFT_1643906 [Desarmillaria tabescens]
MSLKNIILALPTLITIMLRAHIFSAFISKEPIRFPFTAWVELSLLLPLSAYHQIVTCHRFLDRLQFLQLSVNDHPNFSGIVALTEAISVFSIAPQLREVRCEDLHNACNFFVFPPNHVKIFSSRVDHKEVLASLAVMDLLKSRDASTRRGVVIKVR